VKRDLNSRHGRRSVANAIMQASVEAEQRERQFLILKADANSNSQLDNEDASDLHQHQRNDNLDDSVHTHSTRPSAFSRRFSFYLNGPSAASGATNEALFNNVLNPSSDEDAAGTDATNEYESMLEALEKLEVQQNRLVALRKRAAAVKSSVML
jgi:hypothetical protein